MRREFLQLAHTYNPEKHAVGGWYVSEKLDGMRAYWDGGWTRGSLTSQVSFANTTKDYRRTSPVRSTGLWSRYGKPIAAPNWWLDNLPTFPLDGELYLGPNRFQELISIVKRFDPVDSDWKNVDYRVFDFPSNYFFLAPGRINNPHWSMAFEDMRGRAPDIDEGPLPFRKVVGLINTGRVSLGSAIWETQERLSMSTKTAKFEVAGFLSDVMEKGGEGLILRKPESIWQPIRTWDLLKVKPYYDDEAIVIGYTWGHGKLEDLMGALIVQWDRKIFELSGFTDKERELYYLDTGSKATGIPGEKASDNVVNPHFPLKTIVTFRYNGLTNAGYPREARYWRKKNG